MTLSCVILGPKKSKIHQYHVLDSHFWKQYTEMAKSATQINLRQHVGPPYRILSAERWKATNHERLEIKTESNKVGRTSCIWNMHCKRGYYHAHFKEGRPNYSPNFRNHQSAKWRPHAANKPWHVYIGNTGREFYPSHRTALARWC